MKKKNGIEKINEITKKPSWESHRDFNISALKIVHEWKGHLEIFASPNRYFRENSRWMPLKKCKLAVTKPHTEFYKRSLSRSGNVLWKSLTLEL